MADHFDNLQESPVFEHLVTLLDISTWAKDTIVHTESFI